MSDHEPTSEDTRPEQGRTEEYPTVAAGLAAPSEPADEARLEASGEDDDWPVKGPARGIRLAVPVAALLAVVLVSAGFWGGAVVEKNHGSSSSGSGDAALVNRLRAARSALGGATGTGTTGTTGTDTTATAGGFPGFGGSSSATTGTVSVVDGNTLYILTSSNALVQVTLGPSTTISRNAKSTAVGLRPGDTVVVEGTAGKNGNVAATSVSATAPGVTSTGGGFGFGRGLGGGAAAGAGSTPGGG